MATEGYELVVHVRQDQAETAEARLQELGALAVTLTDAGDHPILEPAPGDTPLWPEMVVTGFFGADADAEGLRQQLARTGYIDVAYREIGEQDWVRTWMDDFRPMQFGRRLWIVPSHCAAPKGADVVVRLDPGLAFGTGTHPTTGLCLRFLEGLDLKGRRVLDYGCGSGVLAIAAAALGAESVVGVDIDPQAEVATRANARENAVEDRVETAAPAELAPRSFDLVVANILAGTLTELAPLLGRLCKPDGRLVLSGLLEEQAELVEQAYRPMFRDFSVHTDRGWVMLAARARGSTNPGT